MGSLGSELYGCCLFCSCSIQVGEEITLGISWRGLIKRCWFANAGLLDVGRNAIGGGRVPIGLSLEGLAPGRGGGSGSRGLLCGKLRGMSKGSFGSSSLVCRTKGGSRWEAVTGSLPLPLSHSSFRLMASTASSAVASCEHVGWKPVAVQSPAPNWLKKPLTLWLKLLLSKKSARPPRDADGAAADVDFSFFSLDCEDRGDCEDPWPLGSGVVPVAPLVPCR